MKTIFISILISLFTSLSLFSQELIAKDSLFIAQEVNAQVAILQKKIEKAYSYLSAQQKEMAVEFTIDTFRVEKFLVLQNQTYPSSKRTIEAYTRAANEYKKLITKVYHIIEQHIKPEDKKLLETSQHNWLSFFESESKLSEKLMSYPEGTIYGLLAIQKQFAMSKARTIELFQYLFVITEQEN